MVAPLPPPNNNWVGPDGKPTVAFSLWAAALPPAALQLVNAANDAAAAAAGVAVGQLYRNGSVVQIRVT